MLRRIIDFARPLVWRLSGLLAFAPRVWRWEILSRLATDMGLTAMAVQTKDGLFLMKVQDRTILPDPRARISARGLTRISHRIRCIGA